MRVTLIHNPTAGAGNVSADRLIGLLRAAGYNPRYQSTKDPEFPSALYEPTDLAIAAGGDGTVTKVAVHLPAPSPAIAIIPLGTANNIATDLGITGTPEQVIASWATASRQTLDLWIATGSWGEHLFLEGCGLGVLTWAAADMHERKVPVTEPSQKLAMARTILRETVMHSEPVAVRVELGDRVLEGDFLLLEVLNIGVVGPRLPLAPEVDPTDGWLDVVYVTEEGREALLEWLDAKAPCEAAMPIFFCRCQRLHLVWQDALIRIGDDFWQKADDGESETLLQAQIGRALRTLTILTPTTAEPSNRNFAL